MAKIDWKKRAKKAEQALAKAAAPKRTGRPPAPPRTPDGKLIAKAVDALACSRGELAEAIAKKTGAPFQQSRLTAANRVDDQGYPLTEEQRTAIHALVEAAEKKTSKTK